MNEKKREREDIMAKFLYLVSKIWVRQTRK